MAANYMAVEAAKNNVDEGTFKSTFSKSKTDDTLALFILTNLLSLGFTSGLAPVFNNSESCFPLSVGNSSGLSWLTDFSDESHSRSAQGQHEGHFLRRYQLRCFDGKRRHRVCMHGPNCGRLFLANIMVLIWADPSLLMETETTSGR